MAAERWRLIRSGPLTGAMNMAIDEALLEAVESGSSPPVLRLYNWQPAAVTLGFGQRGDDAVNHGACRSLGLDVVRRHTGGRAVLHESEVTYAVIAPVETGRFGGSILGNYRAIAEVLLDAVASTGLAATLSATRSAGGGQGAQRSACFTAPSHYELLFRGCKIAGSSQRRQGRAFLQHGSIPVDLDLERLFTALNTRADVPLTAGVRALSGHVGWLNRWLARPLSVAEAEAAVLESFARCWGIALEEGGLSAREEQRAQGLARDKYGSPAWTLRGHAGSQATE